MNQCTVLPAAMVASLVKAQGVIRSLSKDGENKQQGFGYVSSEKIVYHAAEALGAHGLHLMRQSTEVGPWDRQEVQGKERATAYLVASVTCTFLLCHESGCVSLSYTLPAVQSAGRPADKAVLATCTELLGYALRDVLLIARGGDDDVRHRKDPGADEADTTGDVTGRPDADDRKPKRQEAPRSTAVQQAKPTRLHTLAKESGLSVAALAHYLCARPDGSTPEPTEPAARAWCDAQSDKAWSVMMGGGRKQDGTAFVGMPEVLKARAAAYTDEMWADMGPKRMAAATAARIRCQLEGTPDAWPLHARQGVALAVLGVEG